MSDLLRMREHDKELRGMKYRPKTVPMSEGPREAWVWCMKAGLSPEVATDVYGFGWSEKVQRIIIPIYENFVETNAFVARSLDKRRPPKYIASANAAGKHWMRMHDDSTIVIVEDILSAIAVSRAGYSSIAAMGTSFDQTFMNKISRCEDVIAWLDPDAGGDKGYRKLRKASGLWDMRLHRVRSNKDPKYYSAADVQAFIRGVKGERHD